MESTKPEIQFESSTQMHSTAEMLALARENEKKGIATSVYEWQFPKVLDAPIPVRSVAATVNALHQQTLRLAAKNPSWDNDRLREALRKKSPEFEDMAARTHPHLFTMIADRDLTEKNFNRVRDLLTIRYMHEQSSDVEANTKTISAYFNQEFYLPKSK